ncbi:MAG: DVU0259 family response regulator domain-containing protein [Thermodesulfobacteriota bacterium]
MLKKILVVDDDSYVVKYLVSLFNDNGYETRSAGDGLEAFEMLRQDKPDLITLDLDMSREWGPKFCRRLTKEDEFKDIPIIVISGLPGAHLAIQKATAFLSKPFEAAELLNIVRRNIGGQDGPA